MSRAVEERLADYFALVERQAAESLPPGMPGRSRPRRWRMPVVAAACLVLVAAAAWALGDGRPADVVVGSAVDGPAGGRWRDASRTCADLRAALSTTRPAFDTADAYRVAARERRRAVMAAAGATSQPGAVPRSVRRSLTDAGRMLGAAEAAAGAGHLPAARDRFSEAAEELGRVITVLRMSGARRC